MKNLLLMVLSVGFLSSCLTLREGDGESIFPKSSQSSEYEETIRALRFENANLKADMLEYDENIRKLKGSVEAKEVLEVRNQLELNKTRQQSQKEFQVALSSVRQERDLLRNKVSELENEKLQLIQNHKTEKEALEKKMMELERKSNPDLVRTEADQYFVSQNWIKAASTYKSYRQMVGKNHEGYAMASYKIGVCFQELSMAKEAKTFFNSVIREFPQSKAADYSSYRLKKM